VLELHGSSQSVVCTGCGAREGIGEVFERIDAGTSDPRCPQCEGIMKTATIMFGEALHGTS
jgi:NAD-dependent deacetylase